MTELTAKHQIISCTVYPQGVKESAELSKTISKNESFKKIFMEQWVFGFEWGAKQ